MGFPREPAGFYEVSKIAIDDHDLSNDFYIFSDFKKKNLKDFNW